MTEWEAKYKSVVSLVEPKHVEAAKKIVELASIMSMTTIHPFSSCIEMILHTSITLKQQEKRYVTR